MLAGRSTTSALKDAREGTREYFLVLIDAQKSNLAILPPSEVNKALSIAQDEHFKNE